MAWIIDDIKSLLTQLRHWQTWLGIGLIGFFLWLAYLVSQYAFRTDSILLYLRQTAGGCREMTNGIIIFMFSGLIFFLFTAILTLGELQRYFHFKQRNAHVQARQSLIWSLLWGLLAIGIAVAALVFFKTYCS